MKTRYTHKPNFPVSYRYENFHISCTTSPSSLAQTTRRPVKDENFEAKPVEGRDLPLWLRPDPIIPNKWNFNFESFDFDFQDPSSRHLFVMGSSDAILSYTWCQLSDFLKFASQRYHQVISPFYPRNISPAMKHSISAIFTRNFPLVEQRYDQLRAIQDSPDLLQDNQMSKTSASYRTLSVAFFHRLENRFNYMSARDKKNGKVKQIKKFGTSQATRIRNIQRHLKSCTKNENESEEERFEVEVEDADEKEEEDE